MLKSKMTSNANEAEQEKPDIRQDDTSVIEHSKEMLGSDDNEIDSGSVEDKGRTEADEELDPDAEQEELKNQLLRVMADNENLRKRTEREVAAAKKLAASLKKSSESNSGTKESAESSAAKEDAKEDARLQAELARMGGAAQASALRAQGTQALINAVSSAATTSYLRGTFDRTPTPVSSSLTVGARQTRINQ